jgi:uncharacterized membrane protein
MSFLAMVAYPFVVWATISRFGVRASSVLVVALAVVLLPVRIRQARGLLTRELIGGGAGLVGLALLAMWFDDRRFLLVLPVLVNLVLLATFGASLLPGREPLVSRIARTMEGQLDEAQERYCRGVTVVWCGFFAVNGSVALAFALFGSLKAWTLYTGLVAYILMGALFAAEYAVRRLRFHR